MARDYSKLSTTIWQSKKFRSLPSDDARLLYFYLHTCPHVTMLGCYVLPERYAAADLEWSIERYKNGIETLRQALLIGYDNDLEMVRVIDFLKHDPFANPNVATSAVNAALKLSDCIEKYVLFQELSTCKHTCTNDKIGLELRRLSAGFPKGIERVSERLANHIETPEPEPEPEPEPLPPPTSSLGVETVCTSAGVIEGEGEVFLNEDFYSKLREAVGLTGQGGSRYWHGPGLAAHVQKWMENHGLGLAQILDVARQSRAIHPSPPQGPKGLDGWMATAAVAIAGAVAVRGVIGGGPESPAEKRLALMAMYAQQINGDGYCPQAQVSPSMAREMIGRGMITAEQCRLRGVTA